VIGDVILNDSGEKETFWERGTGFCSLERVARTLQGRLPPPRTPPLRGLSWIWVFLGKGGRRGFLVLLVTISELPVVGIGLGTSGTIFGKSSVADCRELSVVCKDGTIFGKSSVADCRERAVVRKDWTIFGKSSVADCRERSVVRKDDRSVVRVRTTVPSSVRTTEPLSVRTTVPSEPSRYTIIPCHGATAEKPSVTVHGTPFHLTLNKYPSHHEEEFLVIGDVILNDSGKKETFWERGTGFCSLERVTRTLQGRLPPPRTPPLRRLSWIWVFLGKGGRRGCLVLLVTISELPVVGIGLGTSGLAYFQ